MENFATPALEHPRFTLWVTPLVFLIAVVAANFTWFLAKVAGLGKIAGAVMAVICLVAGLPAAVWVLKTHRSDIEIVGPYLQERAGGQLRRRIDLRRATFEPRLWAKGFPYRRIGLAFVAREGGTRLVIGATGPQMIERALAVRAKSLSFPPPTHRVSDDAMRELVHRIQTIRDRGDRSN